MHKVCFLLSLRVLLCRSELEVRLNGDPERRSDIILAACPLAKANGVTTAERIGEALVKCPNLTIIRPRMEEYLRVSLQITNIYRTFTDLVEVFSVDESFLDLTGTLHLFGSPESMAKQIQRKVMMETGVYVRALAEIMGHDSWIQR